MDSTITAIIVAVASAPATITIFTLPPSKRREIPYTVRPESE